MNIILLGNYLLDEQESMQRYAEMLRNLLTSRGHHVDLIRPRPFLGRIASSGIGKWFGYIDKFVIFPLILRIYIHKRKKARKPENSSRKTETFLIHISDHSNAIYTRWLESVPHLVTCHDVLAIQSAHGLFPEHKTGWTGRLLQKWILSGLKGARHIVCVSEETRKNLLSLIPELKNRTRIIENALNYPYAPMPEDRARKHLFGLKLNGPFQPQEDRFFLHVGGNQWYKNRAAVIRIFGHLCATSADLAKSRHLKLIMVGKPPTETMLNVIHEQNIAGKVLVATEISNEQLCALYSLAEALVFPSLKEGFGWPIIEAQACGCPVVASDRAPMNRLGGPAALLANPEDPADFARQLRELLTEDPLNRHRRKMEAQRHAANYSPDVFLEQMLETYEAILQK